MKQPGGQEADSHDPSGQAGRDLCGPAIPGVPASPAFTLSGHEPSPIPVLVAVPHAGRSYPADLTARMRDPDAIRMRLEDRFVDHLALAIRKATGATTLIAHAPRALIDLNRAPDDIDWGMIAGGSGAGIARDAAGKRWRSGLGLLPRRLPGLGEMWRGSQPETDLAARLTRVHEPYHVALAAALAGLRDRWGAALLIDLHSMPPLPASPGHRPAEFVIGDRFGVTCDGRIAASCFGYFAAHERLVAHNRPYAGDYVLSRHAAPRRGINALQLEIDRRSYLDSRLDQPGPGFDAMVELLTGLVRSLSGLLADMGSRDPQGNWAEAAE